MWYIEAIKGMLAGITYAATSYFKKEGQVFDKEKFLTSVVIGGIVGISYSFTSYDLPILYELFGLWGLTAAIENFLKIIYRKLWKKYEKKAKAIQQLESAERLVEQFIKHESLTKKFVVYHDLGYLVRDIK
jgi:hypothetical protein